jgi:hypothetical protein
MPQISNFIEFFQERALNNPLHRADISKDRTYIQTKIWVTNIVKTIRIIFQMVFVAFLIG